MPRNLGLVVKVRRSMPQRMEGGRFRRRRVEVWGGIRFWAKGRAEVDVREGNEDGGPMHCNYKASAFRMGIG